MGRRPKKFNNLGPFRGHKSVRKAAAAAEEKAIEESDLEQQINELRDRAAADMAIALAKLKADEEMAKAAAEKAEEARSYKALCLRLDAEAAEVAGDWDDGTEFCCDCTEAESGCTCPRYDAREEENCFSAWRCEVPTFAFAHRRGSPPYIVARTAAADGAWIAWMGSMTAQWSHTRAAPATDAEGLHCQKLGLVRWSMLDFQPDFHTQRAKVLWGLKLQHAKAKGKLETARLLAMEETAEEKQEKIDKFYAWGRGELPDPNEDRVWSTDKNQYVGGVAKKPGRQAGVRGAGPVTAAHQNKLDRAKKKAHAATGKERAFWNRMVSSKFRPPDARYQAMFLDGAEAKAAKAAIGQPAVLGVCGGAGLLSIFLTSVFGGASCL
jgi:hypothetical protein